MATGPHREEKLGETDGDQAMEMAVAKFLFQNSVATPGPSIARPVKSPPKIAYEQLAEIIKGKAGEELSSAEYEKCVQLVNQARGPAHSKFFSRLVCLLSGDACQLSSSISGYHHAQSFPKLVAYVSSWSCSTHFLPTVRFPNGSFYSSGVIKRN